MKNAFITGVTGQDGHHLSELLLSKGYQVFGLVNGQRNLREEFFRDKFPDVKLIRGDLTDFSSLANAIQISAPTEVYNLGAISFVGLSFSQPELTANITGLGSLRLLEAIRKSGNASEMKFYQASSSEMFGKALQVPQNETTPFYPRSPYGVAKTFAHYSCVNYRESYDMHVSCGILFNHEGEFRGPEFVTRKITQSVARILLGLQNKVVLGDLTPKRDWGYAGDYVEAMWLMLQQDKPDDYVIATGVNHSVEEFVLEALKVAGLEPDVDKYVEFDSSLKRPAEVDILLGDASKARKSLGWEPKLDFKGLVRKMLENDIIQEKLKFGGKSK